MLLFICTFSFDFLKSFTRQIKIINIIKILEFLIVTKHILRSPLTINYAKLIDIKGFIIMLPYYSFGT